MLKCACLNKNGTRCSRRAVRNGLCSQHALCAARVDEAKEGSPEADIVRKALASLMENRDWAKWKITDPAAQLANEIEAATDEVKTVVTSLLESIVEWEEESRFYESKLERVERFSKTLVGPGLDAVEKALYMEGEEAILRAARGAEGADAGRCACRTRDGARCGRRAVDGSDFCRQHAGCVPAPPEEQGSVVEEARKRVEDALERLETLDLGYAVCSDVEDVQKDIERLADDVEATMIRLTESADQALANRNVGFAKMELLDEVARKLPRPKRAIMERILREEG